ncbi:DEAD/DEAH box helicase [uncultured Propionibacterium sp.]|uniref:DEAD/DEAH box helicase n=1 Tax=uncultured Propionibacterium sp. TaxID=218066 RepID=UPI00292E3F26|nr:DEAD/DEAH box helicase [uncultured Propionibacterium sp.]
MNAHLDHDPAASVQLRWLARLNDEILLNHYPQRSVERGAAYAGRAGIVTDVHLGPDALSGRVRGTLSSPYDTSIRFICADQRVITWSDSCTCPKGKDCKHAAALLMSARSAAQLVLEGRATASAPVPTSSWERAMARLAPERGGTRRLAVVFESSGIAGYDYAASGRWHLHLLRTGVDGDWVGRRVRWRDLVEHPDMVQARPDQRGAVLGLAQLMSDDTHTMNRVTLESLPAEIWAQLRRAVGAGVELLHDLGDRRHALVHLDREKASLGLDLAAVGDDYELRVQLIRAGRTEPFRPGWTLLGEPAHGILRTEPRGELRLTELDRSVDQSLRPLLDAAPSLALPADDLPRFLSLYAPQLRGRMRLTSSEADVDVNEPPASGMWVQIDFSRVDRAVLRYGVTLTSAGHSTRLELERCPADLIGERTRLLLERMRGLVGGLPAELSGRALLDFVGRELPGLETDPGVLVESIGARPAYTELTAAPQLSIEVLDEDPDADDGTGATTAVEDAALARSTDWFGLSVTVGVGDRQVPVAQLLAAMAAGDDHVMLGDGSWIDLEQPGLDPLRHLVSEASRLIDPGTGRMRLSRWDLGAWQDLQASGAITAASARWQRSVAALLSLDETGPAAVPGTIRAELRPYQVEGYRWLAALWTAGLGGILADDMGLGKTLQTLALIARARQDGESTRPALVIAPTSVMAAWTGEARKFAPSLRIVVIDQTATKSGVPLARAVEGADVVVASYTLVRLDETSFTSLQWSLLVLDEAQFVKNHAAKTYSVVRRLLARIRLVITGTPLENSLMDLWSLLSIAAPGLFPDPKRFQAAFARPIESGDDPNRLDLLHRRTRPLMLRRTKEQVAAELPPKQEFVMPVALSRAHRRIYDRELAAARMRVLGLLDDNSRTHRVEILAALTRLRQLSLHPGLLEEADTAVGSAKIDSLVEQLHSLAGAGHRALVFSQFTGFLKLVRERLTEERIGWEYLDGRTRRREERVRAFKEGDATAFLISLKAGGFGLTLTEADYVFVLDPWWNPAAERQAIDRTHRIGQDKQVMVYRMVSADTIEEKVVELQQRKRDLFDQVVGDEALSSGALTLDDIRGLLA